jgi:Putative DNA-binding domain
VPTNLPMSSDVATLHELQLRLRRAVIGDDESGAALADEILGDGLDHAARVRIYRHHAVLTLGDALQRSFPVVCRLVDERFFAFAAHEYLRARPPRSRCLAEYGADFADFLGGFAPCRNLPYLADVARFEWTLNLARSCRETPPLDREALAAIPPSAAAAIVFHLQRSAHYLQSPWPIDLIFAANQEGDPPPVDLASGGACLEIRRAGEAILWRRLDPGTFAFRAALAAGRPLAAAMPAARLADPAFDAAVGLRQVLAEGLATDFTIPAAAGGFLAG